MTFLQSVLLGIVFSFSELIPFSGTIMLYAAKNFFDFNPSENELSFVLAVIYFGIALSLFFSYFLELRMVVYGIRSAGTKHPTTNSKISKRMTLLYAFSMLPMILFPFIRERLSFFYESVMWFGIVSVLNGILIVTSMKYNRGNKAEEQMTIGDALFIGFTQFFSVIPGVSRTGLTYCACHVSGFDGEFSLQYSYLLGLPVYFLFSLASLTNASGGFVSAHFFTYLAVLVLVTATGIAVNRMMRWMAAKNFLDFPAYFGWSIGFLILILSFIH